MNQAQLASAAAADFDPQGHPVGCPTWARLWEARWGRENLDRRTLDNLDRMKASPATSCGMCIAEQEIAEQEQTR